MIAQKHIPFKTGKNNIRGNVQHLQRAFFEILLELKGEEQGREKYDQENENNCKRDYLAFYRIKHTMFQLSMYQP